MSKHIKYSKKIAIVVCLCSLLLLATSCTGSNQNSSLGYYSTPMATVRPSELLESDDMATNMATFTPPVDTISGELREIANYVDSQEDSIIFARCYVEHNPPTLHVNVVSGKLEEANLPEVDGLIIHEVKYSLAELEKARSIITNRFMGKGVNSLSVSPYTNTVRVGLEVEDDELRSKILKAIPNEDMVTFEIIGRIIPF